MLIIPRRNWRYPMAIERQYRKELVALVRQMAKCTKDEQDNINLFIQENRMDAISDKISNLTDNIKQNYYLKITREFLQRKIDQIFETVSNFNSKEFSQIIKQSIGIDIFQSEPDLYELMQLWAKENVNLIKSVESNYFDRLENIISSAVREGTLTKNVVIQIQALTGVSERRAQLIAVDQIGKLNGQLTMYRQVKAGINEYIWRTSGDNRVRPSHRLRDRKRFKWNNPPPDGHPGMPIRCRCTAIPVIDTDTLGQANTKTTSLIQEVVSPKNNLYANTTKLKNTMPKNDYDDYINILSDNKFIKPLYEKYADKINTIKRLANAGRYLQTTDVIEYDFVKDNYIKTGRNKFSTLAHEYGHFFDVCIKRNFKQNNALDFKEIELIQDIIKSVMPNNTYLENKVCFSDNFLKAVRKDRELLKVKVSDREFRDMLSNDNSSAGLQDAIDGLFVNSRIRWGHGEKYYNRRYTLLKKFGLHKGLQAIYKKLGFDVSNQNKVKAQCRIYDATSEIWANMIRGLTVGGKELEYMKTYLPNTYKEFIKIMEMENNG